MLNVKIFCKSSIDKEILEIADKNAIIVLFDLKGRITHANKKCCIHTGYENEYLIGKSYKLFFKEIAIKDKLKEIKKKLFDKKGWEGIVKNKYDDGSTHWMLVSLSPILDAQGAVIHFSCYCVDFTSNINQQKHIAVQNTYDELTGLYKCNMLDKIFNRMEHKNTSKVFILMDILNFMEINTFYGISQGDEVLKQAAHKLQKKFPWAKIFRTKGNSFGLLVDDKNIKKIINSLIQLFEFALCLDNEKIYLSVKIGISIGSKDLYKNANSAIFEAKSTNKNYIIHDENLTNKLINTNNEKKKLTKILNNAIKKDMVVPFFQPIYCNKEKKILKYECLARIVTDDAKVYMPIDFIELSKKIGKYEYITKIMIRKAFKYFYNKQMKFSINLSICDIVNDNIKEFIYKELSQFPTPTNVIFEILEDEELFRHEALVIEFIKEVKKIGCEISIDDFGTGYSNFSNLMNMDIDYLKIDGSIIGQLNDKRVFLILKNIVTLSKDLQVKTVAEFVSSRELQEKVVELGIDFSQGWEIGKPSVEIKE